MPTLRRSSLGFAAAWLVLLCAAALTVATAWAPSPPPLSSLACNDAAAASFDVSEEPKKTPRGPILVVGATGGTGLRALKGLLDAGCEASSLRLLTRNPSSPSLLALKEQWGVQICKADLDDSQSEDLKAAVAGCVGCYVHALVGDTKRLTTGGVDRAQALAKAIASHAHPDCHVVLNSAVGEDGHGVQRIQQMHDIEQVFREDFSEIPFTGLRANLFMEEFWKQYTRPSILKGKFPFSVPSDRRIYLTSVRDMGFIAGTCIATSCKIGSVVNVAGDVLTAEEIAAAFGKAQQTACSHSPGRLLAFLSSLLFRDLYQIIRFYRRSTETTDVESIRSEFGGTDFSSFLDETEWKNEDLAYENFGDLERVLG